MTHNFERRENISTLVIHSTDNSFGFGYRKNNNPVSDELFIKKFDKDLCNNLIIDFDKFISKKNLQKVNKISVSIGPANFNASRLIVVLARTLSQQINCPLLSFSSYELMAKRIAKKNNIFYDRKLFWIYKKLRRRGYIAGQYQVCMSAKKNKSLLIREKTIPKIVPKIENIKPIFEACYDNRNDLIELLNLSNKNLEIFNFNSWENVLPLYPLSPIN